MTTVWGILTVGASPVQISTTQLKCCKLYFQVAPAATGNVKVGSVGLTSDNTTPGTFLSSTASTNPDGTHQAGASWSVESHEDKNTLDASTYYIHGTHAGDLVFYEYHQN